ncbi:MAG: N-acetyltransferase [Cocleimonas sp.]|nr:N-acetyltransferase [Cocleimonas sp.]
MIRIATTRDAEQICTIYNNYIEHTWISFEENTVSIKQMQQRIKDISASFPWLVYEVDQQVLGYAYASTWKMRSAYRYSIESTVYLSKQATGQGIGGQLYAALMAELKETDAHSVMGCIALPNEASIALHEKAGFEKVAHFKEVGRKFDQWIDVGYWELIL